MTLYFWVISFGKKYDVGWHSKLVHSIPRPFKWCQSPSENTHAFVVDIVNVKICQNVSKFAPRVGPKIPLILQKKVWKFNLYHDFVFQMLKVTLYKHIKHVFWIAGIHRWPNVLLILKRAENSAILKSRNMRIWISNTVYWRSVKWWSLKQILGYWFCGSASVDQ